MAQDFPGSYTLPYTAYAELTPSVAVGMVGLLIVLALIPQPFRVPAALALLFLTWRLSARKIRLTSDRVRHVTLTGQRELRYSDVARLEAWMARGRSRYGGYAVPMLGIYARGSDEPLTISNRPFSKRDMAVLVDAIATANPAVELNRLAQMLRWGDVD